MASLAEFRDITLSFPDVIEAPHFYRTAFKVKRIFVTVDALGRTANLKFTPDEQEFKCQLAPEIFRPIDNGWGRQGWTTMLLGPATHDDIRAAIEMAYAHAVAGPARKSR
jgi:hypothetical protein